MKSAGAPSLPRNEPTKDFFWCEFMRDGSVVTIQRSGVGWKDNAHAINQCGMYGERVPTLFETLAKCAATAP